MAAIAVFNNLPFPLPVVSKKKFLTPPKINLNVNYTDDDIREMPPKQKIIFDKAFNAAFDAKFNALGTGKVKAVQGAMDWTEDQIEKKKTKEERIEVVNTANKLIQQAMDTFASEIQSLCDKCYAEAFAKSQKEMKLKLTKAKAKSIAKIIIIGALILTATALAITATVMTGGIAAPAIIAAILAGGGALYKVYQTSNAHWASAENAIKVIQKDIDTLQKSVAVLQDIRIKVQYGADPSLKDKVMKLKSHVDAAMADTDKHVGQLDKFIFAAQEGLKQQYSQLQGMADKLTQAKDPALEKKAGDLKFSIEKASRVLVGLHSITTVMGDLKKVYLAEGKPDFGKLDAVLKAAGEYGPLLAEIGGHLKGVVDGAKKLG